MCAARSVKKAETLWQNAEDGCKDTFKKKYNSWSAFIVDYLDHMDTVFTTPAQYKDRYSELRAEIIKDAETFDVQQTTDCVFNVDPNVLRIKITNLHLLDWKIKFNKGLFAEKPALRMA